MTIKKSRLPTILGLIVLVIGTFFGVFLINSRSIFRLGASGESAPKDIRTSNISDVSLTISWITDKETSGFILWEEKEPVSDNLKSAVHSVTVTGLKPQTTYSYKINSDGTVFDNEGIPWDVTTGSALDIGANSVLISGTVISATGEPVKKSLVYANVGGYLSSTLTSDTGNYVFQLGSTRSQDLTRYLEIDKAQTLVEIFVQTGTGETSSAQIFPQSAKPVPPMVLGQTHDFRSLPPSQEGEIPSSSLELPEGSEEESKFSVPAGQTPTSTESVTLESIDEGEVVTSTEPEFFGDGPKGVTLTITVESENPITDSVTVAQNGSWNWEPPEGLAEGTHKITITWKDISGITRSLTRSFVVQAGEAPAFEASESASTSTPTSTPTASPKATIQAATPTATASSVPVPETGSLTPTILFTILGIGVFALSLGIWKFSENA